MFYQFSSLNIFEMFLDSVPSL